MRIEGDSMAKAGAKWPAAIIAGLLAFALGLGGRPGRALADSREIYTYASLVPAISSIREPGGRSTVPSGGVQLAVLYGLDNEIHVGGRLLFGWARNATFGSSNTAAADGSVLSGTLIENVLQVGMYASAAWRFDTSPFWAPVVQVDLGMTLSTLPDRVVILPATSSHGLLSGDVPTVRSYLPSGRLALLAQHRLGDSWVIEAGLALRAEVGSRGALHAELPITAGWIF